MLIATFMYLTEKSASTSNPLSDGSRSPETSQEELHFIESQRSWLREERVHQAPTTKVGLL